MHGGAAPNGTKISPFATQNQRHFLTKNSENQGGIGSDFK